MKFFYINIGKFLFIIVSRQGLNVFTSFFLNVMRLKCEEFINLKYLTQVLLYHLFFSCLLFSMLLDLIFSSGVLRKWFVLNFEN